MENENIETESVEIMDVSIVEAQDRAMIDMQIATAKKYPRNVRRAVENSIAIITMDIETAKTCHYSLPRGGKPLTGPSIHLAKILAQNWGNLRMEAKVIGTDNKHVTSQAVCFDLESNVAIKVEVKRSIMGKQGRYSDDMITVTGNAANSIALRNAILSVIPKGAVDKCSTAAKGLITGDISDETKLIKKRKQVVDGLRDTYSVTEKEILSAIGKQAISHITSDDLIVLIGIGQAIKDGDTTIEEAFRKQKGGSETIALEDLQMLFDMKKPLLSADELKNATRIIEGKEENSYSKLQKILSAK